MVYIFCLMSFIITLPMPKTIVNITCPITYVALNPTIFIAIIVKSEFETVQSCRGNVYVRFKRGPLRFGVRSSLLLSWTCIIYRVLYTLVLCARSFFFSISYSRRFGDSSDSSSCLRDPHKYNISSVLFVGGGFSHCNRV